MSFSFIYYFVTEQYEIQRLHSIEYELLSMKNTFQDVLLSDPGISDSKNNDIFYPSLLRGSHLSYLLYFDANNVLQFSFNFDKAIIDSYTTSQNEMIISPNRGSYQYASVVKNLSGEQGFIYLGYSLHDFNAGLNELESTILQAGFAVIFVGLFVFLFVGKKLVTPLYTIIDTAICIADGDFTKRVEISNKGELGTLAFVFNNMVEKMFTVNYELEHINNELELRVNDRTVELIAAKEKAEESEKLKSAFLAQMSHEIRTPINTILNYISLIKEELDTFSSESIDESFEAIDSGSRRLIRTIDSVLNMSQFYAGSFEVQYDKLSLREDVIDDLRNEFKPFVDNKNLYFNIQSDIDDDYIVGDKYTVTQMFSNLIDNAIKYTNEGSITVDIRNHDEDRIAVEVSDTGIGMSEEFLQDLFQPFTQEETGYTRKFEGNGLGLALVQKYIDINYGIITVESTKGKGTKFRVLLNKHPKPDYSVLPQLDEILFPVNS